MVTLETTRRWYNAVSAGGDQVSALETTTTALAGALDTSYCSTRVNADAKQSNTPTLADLAGAASFDPFLYASYQYFS